MLELKYQEIRGEREMESIIKQKRKEKNMTLEEVGKLVGVGKSTVRKWENGLIENMGRDKIVLLSKALNISPLEILGVDEKDLPTSSIYTIYEQLEDQRKAKVYSFAEQQLNEQNNIVDFPRSIVTGRSSAAGAPINGDNEDCNSSTMIVDTREIPKSADEIVTIAGDSMEPTYEQGSQVFVHWQPGVEQGEVAIVAIHDEGVTCKKVYYDWENGEIILRSINEKYEDRIFPMDDVRVIGKVL